MRLLLVKICAIAAVNLVAGGAQAEAPNVSINSARALQLNQDMKHLRTHPSTQHEEDERGFNIPAALGEAMEKYSSGVFASPDLRDNAFKSALESGHFNDFFTDLSNERVSIDDLNKAMTGHQNDVFAALRDAYASYVNKIHTDRSFVNKKRFNIHRDLDLTRAQPVQLKLAQPVHPTLAGSVHPNLDITLAQPGQPKLAQPGQPKLAQPGQPKLAQPGQPKLAQSGQPKLAQPVQATLAQPGQPKLAQPIHPSRAGSVHPNLDLTLAQHVHNNLDLTLAQPVHPTLAGSVHSTLTNPVLTRSKDKGPAKVVGGHLVPMVSIRSAVVLRLPKLDDKKPTDVIFETLISWKKFVMNHNKENPLNPTSLVKVLKKSGVKEKNLVNVNVAFLVDLPKGHKDFVLRGEELRKEIMGELTNLWLQHDTAPDKLLDTFGLLPNLSTGYEFYRLVEWMQYAKSWATKKEPKKVQVSQIIPFLTETYEVENLPKFLNHLNDKHGMFGDEVIKYLKKALLLSPHSSKKRKRDT